MPKRSAHDDEEVSKPVRRESAQWPPEDMDQLAELAKEHRAEAGDGGKFKKEFYSKAAKDLNLIRTKGAPKTSKNVEDKYNTVQIEAFAGSSFILTRFYTR
jgi:hypothetical protein